MEHTPLDEFHSPSMSIGLSDDLDDKFKLKKHKKKAKKRKEQKKQAEEKLQKTKKKNRELKISIKVRDQLQDEQLKRIKAELECDYAKKMLLAVLKQKDVNAPILFLEEQT